MALPDDERLKPLQALPSPLGDLKPPPPPPVAPPPVGGTGTGPGGRTLTPPVDPAVLGGNRARSMEGIAQPTQSYSQNLDIGRGNFGTEGGKPYAGVVGGKDAVLKSAIEAGKVAPVSPYKSISDEEFGNMMPKLTTDEVTKQINIGYPTEGQTKGGKSGSDSAWGLYRQNLPTELHGIDPKRLLPEYTQNLQTEFPGGKGQPTIGFGDIEVRLDNLGRQEVLKGIGKTTNRADPRAGSPNPKDLRSLVADVVGHEMIHEMTVGDVNKSDLSSMPLTSYDGGNQQVAEYLKYATTTVELIPRVAKNRQLEQTANLVDLQEGMTLDALAQKYFPKDPAKGKQLILEANKREHPNMHKWTAPLTKKQAAPLSKNKKVTQVDEDIHGNKLGYTRKGYRHLPMQRSIVIPRAEASMTDEEHRKSLENPRDRDLKTWKAHDPEGYERAIPLMIELQKRVAKKGKTRQKGTGLHPQGTGEMAA